MIEQRLAPNPNTVLNIAFCFEAMERWDEAYVYFAEYLASGEEHAERRAARRERALVELRPRVALVRVESEPAGARIFVDRAELGEYGETPRVLALPPGEHTIWVEAEGHRRAERTLTIGAGDDETVSLAPERIVGQLRLTSPETTASVRVLTAEGETAFEGPTPVETTLPVGHYDVHASAGDERWNDAVTIREGETTEVEATLEGPTGEVTVVANRPGALVRLDGHEWGFTPQILEGIPVGEHTLEVLAEGARSYEGPVEVREEDRARATVTLSLEPEGPFTADTFIFGGVALALLAGGALFTGLASMSDASYREAQQMGQPYLAQLDETNRFAVTADLLWLTGGAAAIATIVLAIAHSIDTSGPSTATVTRGER